MSVEVTGCDQRCTLAVRSAGARRSDVARTEIFGGAVVAEAIFEHDRV